MYAPGDADVGAPPPPWSGDCSRTGPVGIDLGQSRSFVLSTGYDHRCQPSALSPTV